jgi:maleate isomerase
VRHWRGEGFKVAHLNRVEIGGADTRGIYALASASAQPAIAALAGADIDAIVLSGTGMPSLALVRDTPAPPILSSNLCLANRLCGALGLPAPDLEDCRQRLKLAV